MEILYLFFDFSVSLKKQLKIKVQNQCSARITIITHDFYKRDSQSKTKQNKAKTSHKKYKVWEGVNILMLFIGDVV